MLLSKGVAQLGFSILALFHTGCCPTVPVITVVRGPVPPSEKTGGGKEVYICPGEVVTVAWGVSSDVTAANVSSIGTVAIPKGFKNVSPTENSTYTLTAQGKCTRTDSCSVHVIKEGSKAVISAALISVPPKPNANTPPQYYWEANLSESVWSPNIVFTSIRMLKFADVKWNQSTVWKFIKADTDGTVHDFPVTWDFTTPWPTPLPAPGNWKLYMIGGEYPNAGIPPFASFEVTMRCK
jgi:hypothetical protein